MAGTLGRKASLYPWSHIPRRVHAGIIKRPEILHNLRLDQVGQIPGSHPRESPREKPLS